MISRRGDMCFQSFWNTGVPIVDKGHYLGKTYFYCSESNSYRAVSDYRHIAISLLMTFSYPWDTPVPIVASLLQKQQQQVFYKIDALHLPQKQRS